MDTPAQLRLVSDNSRKTLKIETLPSSPRNKSRDNSSISSFQRKAAELEHRNPRAARLIEQLFDDALSDACGQIPDGERRRQDRRVLLAESGNT